MEQTLVKTLYLTENTSMNNESPEPSSPNDHNNGTETPNSAQIMQMVEMQFDFQNQMLNFALNRQAQNLQDDTRIAVAVTAYEATGINQVSLKVGDLIQILEMATSNDFWLGAIILSDRYQSQEVGLFPCTTVKVLPAEYRDLIVQAQREQAKSTSAGLIELLKTILKSISAILQCLKAKKINDNQSEDSDEYDDDGDEEFNCRMSNIFELTVNSSSSSACKNSNIPEIYSPRLEIAREFADSEGKFIDEQNFTIQNFREPIQRHVSLSAKDAIESYFGCMEHIYEVHNSLNNNLQEQLCNLKSSTNLSFGDILLLYFFAMLPIYRSFVALNTVKLMSIIESNQRLICELTKLSTQSTSLLSYKQYLLRPLLRITRYQTLIETMLKHTPPESQDYDHCVQMLDMAKQFCEEINRIYKQNCTEWQCAREFDWIQSHVHIPDSIVQRPIVFNSNTSFLGNAKQTINYLIKLNPTGPRILLHTGIISKDNRQMFAFLFNDFILFACPDRKLEKTSSEQNLFDHPDIENVTSCVIYEKPFILDQIQMAQIDRSSPSCPGFNVFENNITTRLYQFQTNSLEEANIWIEKAHEAKENYEIVKSTQTICRSSLNIIEREPKAILFLNQIEAIDLCTQYDVLQVQCTISIGTHQKQAHTNLISESIHQQIKGTNSSTWKTFNSSWQTDYRINIYNLDEQLFISFFDVSPFEPHQCLGEAQFAIWDLMKQTPNCSGVGGRSEQNSKLQRSLVKGVPLTLPDVELGKSLLAIHRINPCLVIQFDIL